MVLMQELEQYNVDKMKDISYNDEMQLRAKIRDLMHETLKAFQYSGDGDIDFDTLKKKM